MTFPRKNSDGPPQFTATFYPGGHDSYTMPELISPAPQRVMPEVPSNMQHGVASLEVEANNVYRQNSTASMATTAHDQYGHGQFNQNQGYNVGYAQTDGPQAYQNHDQNYSYNSAPAQPMHAPPPLPTRSASYNAPLPSPFPSPINPGPNVPPSDEQKEEDLEHSREAVLNSNDPERQLNWAQAALHWSDNAIQSRIRAAVGSDKGRPITPTVERKIREDALQVVSFLADQLHPKADFLRSTWYEFGKFGYPEDTKEAFAGYRRAAEKGYARAEYRMGTKYEAMKDMAHAIQHYQQGVANGDSASNYRMGMMSLLGQHGQPQNFEAAVSMIRFAADTADENAPQGAYVYGMLLARELPNIVLPEYVLPYDAELARHYIERAAFLGFAKAQLKMGSAFELCLLGCEFEPRLSLHYNRLAAGQGEPEAEMAISKWFLCGYEGVFAKNEDLAFQYAKRAAQQEYPTAEFALGYFYELGLVTPGDLGKAKEYYQKAADHGNTDAPARLNALSLHRTLSRKDHEQVAITKIKSQYGSRRGQRPDHLVKKAKDAAPNLMSMSERNDDSPVNGEFPLRGSSTAPVQPPFRVVTPQPLPEVPQTSPFHVVPQSDQGHSRGSSDPYARGRNHKRNSSSGNMLTPFPGQNGALPPRPRSAAPYPEEDHNRRPTSSGLSVAGPPADRPNSAFGIRPLNNQALSPGPASPGLRPSSSHSNLQQPPNRTAPGVGNGQQLPYRGHTPTVPDVQKRSEKPTTKDWESQYRLPYQGEPAKGGKKQGPQGQHSPQANTGNKPNMPGAQAGSGDRQSPRPQQPPAIQTSLSGDNYGPNRQQGAQSAQPSQQRQDSMLHSGYNQPHSAYPGQQQRPGSSQHTQSFPNPQRPNTASGMAALGPGHLGHQNTFPERRSSMLPPMQGQQQQQYGGQQQQQAPAMTISPAPAPQAARPPPKKGPQTFEEMGVPAAPKESECVLM